MSTSSPCTRRVSPRRSPRSAPLSHPNNAALLWRMAEEPILCFDGDRAGRKAAFRAIETALPLIGPGRSLRFAFLPDGQDPDDLVRSAGPAAVEDVIAEAKPLVDVLWQRELEAQPLDTPERRASFESRAFQALQAIGDENLRRHYREEMAARLSRPVRPRRPRAAPGREGRPEAPARRGRGGRPAPRAPGARGAAHRQPGARPLLAVFAGKARRFAARGADPVAALNHPADRRRTGRDPRRAGTRQSGRSPGCAISGCCTRPARERPQTCAVELERGGLQQGRRPAGRHGRHLGAQSPGRRCVRRGPRAQAGSGLASQRARRYIGRCVAAEAAFGGRPTDASRH